MRPMFAVALDYFEEVAVEADTAASARWAAASACHEAGYGRNQIELIRRGCRVRPISRIEAEIFIHRHIIAPVRSKPA
jgi:hypothetical protein